MFKYFPLCFNCFNYGQGNKFLHYNMTRTTIKCITQVLLVALLALEGRDVLQGLVCVLGEGQGHH